MEVKVMIPLININELAIKSSDYAYTVQHYECKQHYTHVTDGGQLILNLTNGDKMEDLVVCFNMSKIIGYEVVK